MAALHGDERATAPRMGASSSAAQVGGERLNAVRRAARRWKDELLDTSGRNRLRNYRDLKTGTLDLTPGGQAGVSAQALDRLLAGRTVRLSDLCSTMAPADAAAPFDDARRRVAAIHKTALTNLEEKGIDTCFAGIGLATWSIEQGTEPNAPVILVPMHTVPTGAATRDFEVSVAGDAHLNPVLTHIVRSEHSIDIENIEADIAEDPPDSLAAFHVLFDQLVSRWSELPGFAITPRVVLGNFSYSTMPLVQDLEQSAEALARNDLVAAIAGVHSARAALTLRRCNPSLSQPNVDPPESEFLILDADSSQHLAINRVLGGESVVIQGPPGTGKSQTISNLIGTLVAHGKRVLFVAEKRAAIEAVTKRLDSADLGDLVMDLHGGVTSRREFARHLSASLDQVATIPAQDHAGLHRQLGKHRDDLLADKAAVHDQREPWKLSAFEMRQRLLDVPDEARVGKMLPSEAAKSIDSASFERLSSDITEWIDLAGHDLPTSHPEWYRSTIQSAPAAREAFELVRDFAAEQLPAARTATEACLRDIGASTPDSVAAWQEALDRCCDVRQMLDECGLSRHNDDLITLEHSAQRAFELSRELDAKRLPAARTAIETSLSDIGASTSDSVAAWQEALDRCCNVRQMLDESDLSRHSDDLYTLDHSALRDALAPARRSRWARMHAQLFSGAYRQSRKGVQETLRRSGQLSPVQALETLEQTERLLSVWSELGAEGIPRIPDGLDHAIESLAAVAESHDSLTALNLLANNDEDANSAEALSNTLRRLLSVWSELGAEGIPRIPDGLDHAIESLAAVAESHDSLTALNLLANDNGHANSIEALSSTLQRLLASPDVAQKLPRIRELESGFQAAGVMPLLERAGHDYPAASAARSVEHAWLSRVLEDLSFADLRLAGFDSKRATRVRQEYAELDRQHLGTTPLRLRRRIAENVIHAMNARPEQQTLIRREAGKKRRHLSIRHLLARAPHVLTALRPCWTMSPVLAAEMIPPDAEIFDVVVFDEASQIPPAEAIGSLARAPQAVIAGDSRQLPPTAFFGRESASDDDPDADESPVATDDIESLLEVADIFLRDTMLTWHYRSRDDRLIAFSNEHIYGGSLTAFPGTAAECPLTHHLVPFRALAEVNGTRSNPDEAVLVAERVLDHARNSAHETLGVIAFGQAHADAIENALMRELRDLEEPALDEFFSEANDERFFVKNIERVQGDERDVIFLSVGYHKDAKGRLPYRFGPLNQEGGERRLNVAVTRARSRIEVVSSFSHHDMEPSRSSAQGVELLRQYLEYAATEGRVLGSGGHDVPLNSFELSVKKGLECRGIPVTPQYGVSGYRIDFACAHPDKPGQMVLAIEADGATYHSTPTARDADRLRQQVLEDQGWRVHRIWSTSWFKNQEAELDKAEAAWRQAARECDRSALSERDSAPTVPRRQPDTAPPTDSGHVDNGPTATQQARRGSRPWMLRHGPLVNPKIIDISHEQLVDVAGWIESDTLLRTESDLMTAMMKELGFQRSGTRITAALEQAIRAARG